MFQLISNIFGGSWDRVRLTAERVRWMLITVFILTIIGVLPVFLGTPIRHSFWLSFPICLFSAYRIFSIRRYLYIAGIGEGIEAVQSIGPKTNETIWDNALAATYRRYAKNIWLAQLMIFLFSPLYFNLTNNSRMWLPIIIMIAFAIAMLSLEFISWIFSAISIATIAIYLLTATYDMFPESNNIPAISETAAKLKANKKARENAVVLGDINSVREKQRQELTGEALKKARDWQEKNKGRSLPTEIRDKIEAAGQGLTLDEFRANNVNSKKEETEKKKENGEKRLDASFKFSSSNDEYQPFRFEKGTYSFEPAVGVAFGKEDYEFKKELVVSNEVWGRVWLNRAGIVNITKVLD